MFTCTLTGRPLIRSSLRLHQDFTDLPHSLTQKRNTRKAKRDMWKVLFNIGSQFQSFLSLLLKILSVKGPSYGKQFFWPMCHEVFEFECVSIHFACFNSTSQSVVIAVKFYTALFDYIIPYATVLLLDCCCLDVETSIYIYMYIMFYFNYMCQSYICVIFIFYICYCAIF
jgi:hypothetical protein